ncbi:steroid 5 alpha-reductase [Cucurbitaria berberidis CBS 394.84]|uniref:Steroid 5 alpha-reductase n=1 Tax=Cucurbitaria berberidis CBS 394.84 TaxID=1168544 RepID=A0A9P4GRJ0_9PLEO|nr:steroid 5 alpha-reductase [Cucurbitaria berberidis CBS 394.84]KAF1850017.1 steroid 5 alpha-reductase [Cucurbitaria berberidis CBS 394.84]
MAIVQDWLPPSRENWELICQIWQYFPIITAIQWVTDYYPQGKTSNESVFNINGKIGWASMESVGFIILLYIMYTLPQELGIGDLPWGNWTMAGCFVAHYIYRAILSPLFLNPSMSPMSPLVWLMAFAFQTFNAISIGGYLAGYGPTTQHEWTVRSGWVFFGLVIWSWGLMGNMFHDDDLREIRRTADRKQRKQRKEVAAQGKAVESVDKIYMIPKNGLFQYVLHAHYLCEWIEWAGWWMVGGWNCVPARIFLVNEVTTMLPRALQGKRWYEKKFGKERLENRKAVIPGLI